MWIKSDTELNGLTVFFEPAPLSEEKVLASIEEKAKTYVTEQKAKEIVEGAIAALKPTATKEGEE